MVYKNNLQERDYKTLVHIFLDASLVSNFDY